MIEPFTEAEKKQFARDFIDLMLVQGLSKKKLEEISHILVNRPFSEFETYLETKTDGWIHGWAQYIYDEAGEYVARWLTENPCVKITETFEGCGDCEICKLMREGKDDLSSLKDAFTTEQVMQSVEKQLNEQRKKKG